MFHLGNRTSENKNLHMIKIGIHGRPLVIYNKGPGDHWEVAQLGEVDHLLSNLFHY